MGGKKQPGRFTIQFNLSDPQQRQVIELLNEQGRRKAVFLTAAVLSYCGKNNVTQILPQPQMDLEAIFVITPNYTHKDIVISCLEAGKHVWCEKPMALTVEECNEMIGAVERTGKML